MEAPNLSRWRRCWLWQLVLAAILVCTLPSVFIAAEFGAPSAAPSSQNIRPRSLASLCNTTSDSAFCLSTLSRFPSPKPHAHLAELTSYVVSSVLAAVNNTYDIGHNLTSSSSTTSKQQGGSFSDDPALQDCMDLLDAAREGLRHSVDQLQHLNAGAATSAMPPAPHGGTTTDILRSQIMNVRVWLSASLTDADTCWDELVDDPSLKERLHGIGEKIEPLLDMALCFAQILQQAGGASTTTYTLPGSYRRRHHHHH